jgi:hypothetical protein
MNVFDKLYDIYPKKRITLKLIFDKYDYDVKMYIGQNLPIGGIWEHDNENSGSTKAEKCLTCWFIDYSINCS